MPKCLCFIPQRPFDLFPNDADKFNAVPDLFSERDSIGAEVLRLSQSEGGDATGVLQPPILRRLRVTRRCHVFAHLVEVVGLRWGDGDVQLFDVFGSDVDDLIDVLQCPFDQQKAGIRHE